MNYHVDEKGYYGEFGGAFIPELLYPPVEELKAAFYHFKEDPDFRAEFTKLLEVYVGRPSPLYYAEQLSQKYAAKIYLKREDLNHTGAHKINSAIGQILLAKRMGKSEIIAETGAGQHGVATATVCALMGLRCKVFMGLLDTERQASNVGRMKMMGAEVVTVLSGSKTLKDATNEAIRYWINHPDAYYMMGSVVGPHPYPEMVAYFQSVISEEISQQLLEKTGTSHPDFVIACVGGGSNAIGAFYHFLDEPSTQLIVAEGEGEGVDSGKTAATCTLGKMGVIHGSRTWVMQTPTGQIVEPHCISAGLDYPGIGPQHAHLAQVERTIVCPVTDYEAVHAGIELARTEGIIPALESAHALAVLEKKSFPSKTVVINLSGRGDKDLGVYLKWL